MSRAAVLAVSLSCGLCLGALLSCAAPTGAPAPAADAQDRHDATTAQVGDDASLHDEVDADQTPDASVPPWPALRVLTVNAGTTEGLRHDRGDDGYTQAMADWVDLHYQNSLSWRPAEAALTAWILQQRPDVIAFQEIFHDPWCDDIPSAPDLDGDLVCQNREASALLQVQRLTGEAFDTACLDDKPDLCVAVRRSVGRIAGCNGAARCHLSVTGPRMPQGCGRRARALPVSILLPAGQLSVVGLHGTSGVSEDDKACRLAMFRDVFDPEGDEPPLAAGDANIVMGDFNTDFDLLLAADASAAFVRGLLDDPEGRWVALSPWRRDQPATYGGALRIDHVLTDAFDGDCQVPGVTPGVPALLDAIYWDHLPILCDALPRLSPAQDRP